MKVKSQNILMKVGHNFEIVSLLQNKNQIIFDL